MRAFEPEAIFLSTGFDAHAEEEARATSPVYPWPRTSGVTVTYSGVARAGGGARYFLSLLLVT